MYNKIFIFQKVLKADILLFSLYDAAG